MQVKHLKQRNSMCYPQIARLYYIKVTANLAILSWNKEIDNEKGGKSIKSIIPFQRIALDACSTHFQILKANVCKFI